MLYCLFFTQYYFSTFASQYNGRIYKGEYMNNGFLKFKKKFRRDLILRSIVFGISLGIIAFSATWIILKTTTLSPNPLIYIGLGAGIALVSTIAAILLFLPTDKRIAKTLDTRLALDEKVQTMVYFRDDSSSMVEIQRNDTEQILSETPVKMAKGKRVWFHAILPILAIALLIAAIIIPQKQPDPVLPEPDPEFDMTTWQEQALKDLIRTVETSNLEADPKQAVVDELNLLLKQLRVTENISSMKSSVIRSIEKIHITVYEHNSFDDISKLTSNSTSNLIKEMSAAIGALNALQASSALKNETSALTADNAQGRLGNASSELSDALGKYEASPADELYATLSELAVSLEALSSAYSGYTDEEAKENIDSLCKNTDVKLTKALYTQYINDTIRESTIRRLMEIFNISDDEIDIDIKSPSNGYKDTSSDLQPDEDPDKMHSGGGGDGEQLFGSNDTIYDPELGYVSYGEVIRLYYGEITALIADGTLDDEIEKIINDYYALLYQGDKKD